MNTFAVIWLVLAVVFAVVEACTVSLVSVWFTIGAIVSMCLALSNTGVIVQIVVFLIVSTLLIIVMKLLLKKTKLVKIQPTNADRIIGQQGIVKVKIDNLNSTGQIELHGQMWTARSKDDSIIDEGEVVTALEITGAKLIVERTEG